jgi:hypothetical protein
MNDGSLSSEKPMCTSYEPNPHERFDAYRAFEVPAFDYKREIYKDYVAPIFRRGHNGWRTDPATFGMVPRKHIPQGVRPFDTMNARGESVGEKRSFSMESPANLSHTVRNFLRAVNSRPKSDPPFGVSPK